MIHLTLGCQLQKETQFADIVRIIGEIYCLLQGIESGRYVLTVKLTIKQTEGLFELTYGNTLKWSANRRMSKMCSDKKFLKLDMNCCMQAIKGPVDRLQSTPSCLTLNQTQGNHTKHLFFISDPI